MQREKFFSLLFDRLKGYIELRTITPTGRVDGRYFYPTSNTTRLVKQLSNPDLPEFQNTNVYFGVCPRNKYEGKEENIEQVNCLWADLDCKWKDKPKEPTREKRLAILQDFKLPPSILIDSGHGYQVYWLLNKPYHIKNNEDKLKMKGYIKGMAIALGGDKVFDLSRILRVPGTKNMKDPKDTKTVKILEFKADRKYKLSEFDQFKVKVEDLTADVKISSDEIPDRFWRILQDDKKIKATWEGKRENLKDKTRSSYDMALADLLMPYNFSDSEVASILKASPSGKGKEAKRQYLTLTVGKARASWNKRKPLPLNDLLSTFKKWLELDETDYIEVILATVLSNEIPGDPVWLFVVGPPGASKTEVLRAFNKLKKIYSLSKLTPQTLISGKQRKDYDPSLLPKLNNKTLIVKDFTSILGIQREARQTIFSDLREAYDGYLDKDFGNIGHRGYEAHFSLIGNVTPVIDRYTSVEQTLGERFLKIRLKASEMDSKIIKAMDNEDKQREMRKELSDTVNRFYNQKFDIKTVGFPDSIRDKTVQLAKFVAICRTAVSRDQFRGNILTYLPEYEIGTRLGIQLKKLGRSLACIRGKKQAGEYEFKILKRIAKDTIPNKRRTLLEFLYRNNFRWLTTSEVAKEIRIERHTCLLALQDLQVLRLAGTEKEEYAQGKPWSWKLTKEMNDLFIKIE